MNRTHRTTALSEPTETEIQHAAYLLWLDSGKQSGRDLDHWLAAKELLLHRHARNVAANSRRRAHAARFSAKF